MPLSVSSVYQDAARDSANKDENGYLSYEMFNRMSRRAELRLLNYITGNVENDKPPIPYLTQKNKDWLSPLIVPHNTSLDTNGQFAKPSDYYGYENMYSLVLEDSVCDNDEPVDCDAVESDTNTVKRYPIVLLDGDKFNQRATTYIAALKPTVKKAIAKEIGNSFEVMPKEIAGVVLDYIKYPVFAEIVSEDDPVFNDEIISETLSTNYEWGEWAREALVYFITDSFSQHISDVSMKQMNNSSNVNLAGK